MNSVTAVSLTPGLLSSSNLLTPDLPSSSNKIITLIHKDTTVPGVVGQKLESMGYQLDIRAPILGDELPHNLDEYAAALVFGGPMSVNDDEPYLHEEQRWIREVLTARLPYLGICLGAQLLAKVLGAKVDSHADGLEEIGYYPVYATAPGAETFPEKLMAYQWHSQGFELPEGAVQLATGEDFANQAFRWGDRTYGLQFHPEMTADMVDFWTEQGADLLGAPNAKPRCEQIEDHVRYSPGIDRWLETFLNNWLAVVKEQA